MSEPGAKKAKLSTGDRQVFFFTKEGEECDRDILIKNTIFHVHSATLTEHSEYFRVMFTSDFMEKDKKKIEIVGVDEGEMHVFLSALFDPKKTDFEENDLPRLCKVFSFFDATGYFVYLLKEKGAFKEIKELSVRNFLKMSVKHGIFQMKDTVEALLISQFVEKFPVTAEKLRVDPNRMFDDYIIESLELAFKFDLLKLKEKVEARLSCDYTRGTNHPIASERRFVDLMIKYELDDLAKSMLPYVLSLRDPHPNKRSLVGVMTTERKYDTLDLYIKTAGEKTSKLRERIENFYIEKARFTQKLLDYARDNKMINLLEGAENVFLKEIQNGNLRRLGKIYNWSGEYGMEKLKVAVAELLIKRFQEGGEIKISTAEEFTRFSETHGVTELKELVEQFWIKKFGAGEEIEGSTIEICSRFANTCDMTKLKGAVEKYLIKDFENTRNFKNLKFAFSRFAERQQDSSLDEYDQYDFKLFEATVTEFLKTSTLGDPVMKSGYEHIRALSDKHKARVLEIMWREPEGEE